MAMPKVFTDPAVDALARAMPRDAHVSPGQCLDWDQYLFDAQDVIRRLRRRGWKLIKARRKKRESA